MEKKKLKSEVFELLSTFSKQEMKKFSEFLNSPFHNKSKKLIKIYMFIRKFYPEFCDSKLSLESIHNHWQPDEKFHAPSVRNDLSDLYTLGLKYLAVESYSSEEHNPYRYDYLFSQLNQRRLFKSVDKLYNKISSYLNGNNGWNIDLPYTKYIVMLHKINKEFFLSEYKGDSNKLLLKNLMDIDKNNEIFQTYYIVKQIEAYIAIKTLSEYPLDVKNLKSVQFLESSSFNNIIKYVKEQIQRNPVLDLALKLFELYKFYEDEKKYWIYKSCFMKNFHLIDNHLKSTHLEYLTNYCTINCEKGSSRNLDFSKERLSLYEIQLENELYKCMDMEYLHFLDFRNMMLNSLSVNLKWTKELISKHIDKLEIKMREPMKNLGLMYVYFEESMYDESMICANKIKPEYSFLKIDVVNTLLRIYYEKKEFINIYNMINTYISFLNKTELITQARVKRNLNFIKCLKNLVLLSEKEVTNNKIINVIDLNIENSAYPSWLSQKLQEIKKGKGIK